jgi:predicted nuclease of predicted toxin-antitoxin system
MKFKLDENFSARTIRLFRQRGYEVDTVRGENRRLCRSGSLCRMCARVACLITLDRDFADVIRLLDALKSERIARTLWIVEAGRIRVHEQPQDE